MLLAYPPGWRARYGDELELLVADLAEHGRRPLPMAADLIRGAAGAWFMMRRGFAMSERSRGALITVLWSWVAFAATAAWFGHDLGRVSSSSQQAFATQPGGDVVVLHPAVSPALPDAYHVLFAAGVIGLVATAFAAVVFAIEAARFARAHQRKSTFALMAVPPVVAAAWLGGLQLLPSGTASTGRLTMAVLWLLLGVAGIAGATQAVCTIIRTTERGV